MSFDESSFSKVKRLDYKLKGVDSFKMTPIEDDRLECLLNMPLFDQGYSFDNLDFVDFNYIDYST